MAFNHDRCVRRCVRLRLSMQRELTPEIKAKFQVEIDRRTAEAKAQGVEVPSDLDALLEMEKSIRGVSHG